MCFELHDGIARRQVEYSNMGVVGRAHHMIKISHKLTNVNRSVKNGNIK
jgi:hypothetical protein